MVTLSSIRIIATPPGQAPDWVRQEWVGLEIPLDETPKLSGTIQMGVLGGPAQHPGGFRVNTRVTLDLLQKKSPDAARWWRENINPDFMTHLIFKREVCEEVA